MRTNCKALKETLKKDVKTLFDFDIEHIKGESHSLPYFLTIKFFLERPVTMRYSIDKQETEASLFIYDVPA
uniref:Putative ovule protein n=1 Tax=Solanum chacoense TaxID=4108 RepID=A0A0V0HUE5_SOLCH